MSSINNIGSVDKGFFMFDVISSTLNKLTPWSGVEVAGDNLVATTAASNQPSVRVETGAHTDRIDQFIHNTVMVDAVI